MSAAFPSRLHHRGSAGGHTLRARDLRNTKARTPRNAGPTPLLPVTLLPWHNIRRRVLGLCISPCTVGRALRRAPADRDYFLFHARGNLCRARNIRAAL